MEKVFKLFVSQPMSGISDEEIIEARKMAFRKFRVKYGDKIAENYDRIDIIDNLQMDANYDHPLKYLANDILMLIEADAMFMVNGWETHRGCAVEYCVATQYGIPVYYEEG